MSINMTGIKTYLDTSIICKPSYRTYCVEGLIRQWCWGLRCTIWSSLSFYIYTEEATFKKHEDTVKKKGKGVDTNGYTKGRHKRETLRETLRETQMGESLKGGILYWEVSGAMVYIQQRTIEREQ